MATKTVTIDTNEWKYVDKFGDEHTITNAQTFTFTLTDTSSTDVQYNIIVGGKVTTTDGYTIHMTPRVNCNNTAMTIGTFADTEDATEVYNKRGEFSCKCPVSGDVQHWRIAKIKINNVDAPTAITSATFEDQFGNVMTIPDSGSGITVS